MTLLYAGVGSRESPGTILEMMTQMATTLANKGFTLRSGGCCGYSDMEGNAVSGRNVVVEMCNKCYNECLSKAVRKYMEIKNEKTSTND